VKDSATGPCCCGSILDDGRLIDLTACNGDVTLAAGLFITAPLM
jgi:hypothetical protein